MLPLLDIEKRVKSQSFLLKNANYHYRALYVCTVYPWKLQRPVVLCAIIHTSHPEVQTPVPVVLNKFEVGKVGMVGKVGKVGKAGKVGKVGRVGKVG